MFDGKALWVNNTKSRGGWCHDPCAVPTAHHGAKIDDSQPHYGSLFTRQSVSQAQGKAHRKAN